MVLRKAVALPTNYNKTFDFLKIKKGCHHTDQWYKVGHPPGETTALGSFMSKAAMFPMAKPYPEWISGSPTDLPTIPGKAATLAICFTPENCFRGMMLIMRFQHECNATSYEHKTLGIIFLQNWIIFIQTLMVGHLYR